MTMRLAFIRCRSFRLAVALAFGVCFFYFITNLQFHSSASKSLVHMRDEIISLSRQYVQAVAAEQTLVQDGPYSGYNTQYDLKKTLAVLIDNTMKRLERVEKIVGLKGNGSGSANDFSIVNAKALLDGVQEMCDIPLTWKSTHPHCAEKVKWMEGFWKTDPCYGHLGVDGSQCSFIIYLSEVENHCPRLPWRPTLPPRVSPVLYAEPRFHLAGLFELMKDNPTNFRWIQMRIERLWPRWVRAYHALEEKQNWTLSRTPRKRILLHLGLLTKESGFKFGEKSLKGGPLGELVQWSDLIASLYILGHELVISSEILTFTSFAQADPAFKSSCPVVGATHVDYIYTDIVGLRQMKRKVPASLQNYKCRLRVLDSFGSHAEFNHQPYFLRNKERLGGKKKNAWGGHALNLQQFYNMFPHTPDNTFLGFVVETYMNISDAGADKPVKENWALVYGKEAYMWKGAEEYLETVRSMNIQIHATVNTEGGQIPSYVVNHGVLPGIELHKLLRKTKMFLGLGFPYEGPAPLEAIANGAVFLNPRFDPPKSRVTEKFFEEKPTLRALKSQNPYVEDFIGEPHVMTFDIRNKTSISEAVKKATEADAAPFLPYEFTHEGMLERVNAFVSYQDFCKTETNWPPFSASRLVKSNDGESCNDACWRQGLICEASYFPKVNNIETVLQYFKCSSTQEVEEVVAPSSDSDGVCYIQKEPLLYSCASQASSNSRLCPCRDFIKDQAALCAACL